MTRVLGDRARLRLVAAGVLACLAVFALGFAIAPRG